MLVAVIKVLKSVTIKNRDSHYEEHRPVVSMLNLPFFIVVVVFYHLGCCDETGLHSFKLNTQIDAAANYNYI